MKNDTRKGGLCILIISVSLLLPACDGVAPDNRGNPQSYTVGGTVSNLFADGLILQDNSCDDLVVSANSTSFTFPTVLSDGEGYNVTVKNQPEMQFCLVNQTSGIVSGVNVRNVDVQCFVRPPSIIRGE